MHRVAIKFSFQNERNGLKGQLWTIDINLKKKTKQTKTRKVMMLRTVPKKMLVPAIAGGSTCEVMNLLVFILISARFYVLCLLRR